MATIITRETGATAVNRTLTNTELDNNFINLNADIATRIPSSEKAAANGVATLDATGKVPSTQLPSYVDDVLEAANLAAFPATGETGKIYVALDTNKAYRWSGSTYIYITSGAVDSVAGRTGAVVLTKTDVGLSNVDNTADADKNVLTATKWASARTLSITGDISGSASIDGSANATITATLPATGVTAGNYGSATAIPVITVDAKGRLTLVSTVAVSIPSGSISVTGGDFSMSGSTGSPITNATLATVNSNVGTFNTVTVNAKGLVTSASNVSYLTSYTETDTLATVTARGATTGTPTTFTGRLTASTQQVVGAERRYYLGSLDAAGAQARRFEIARVYIDYNDWHNGGTIRVELHNQYYLGGDRQVWNISYDYNNINCDLVESIGPRGRLATVTCGNATQISGDYYYLPIYVDVRYYGRYVTYLTTTWPETTAHQADSGVILVYTTPSGSNIGDFTPSDAMSFRASSLSLSGNAVLHTNNYSSYALPLFGGTLTGKLTVTATAGLDLYRLTFDADGSDSYYRATSGNRHRFTTTGGADFIIGNGTGVATLNGYQLLTAGNYTDYKPTVLVSPNGATVVSADSAFPGTGQTFQHSLATGPSGNDGHILAMSWANTASIYGAQIWLDTDPTNRMAIRSRNSGGTWNSWSEVLTSSNISSYALAAESDTLATVTARGASTGTAVTLSSGGNHYSGHFYYDPYDAAGNHYPHFTDGSSASGSKVNWRLFSGGTNSVTHQWTVSNTDFSNNVRSPIFYDLNDTTYYLDPNNTSTSAVLAGNISLNGVIVRRSAGTGYLSGNYSSSETTATTGAIYTIGGSYYPTSSGLNNMYGIGYTYAGVAGGTASATSSSAWGLYVASNGTTRVFLDSDYGRVIASGDMRAPLYYDRDNTSYYVDPASTSRLNGLIVGYGNASSTIDMYDSDESTRYIHNNSGTIGFLNSSGSWRFRMGDDGNVIMGTYQDWLSNQIRSSIFYDHSDTGYYTDPNGTSTVNLLNARSLMVTGSTTDRNVIKGMPQGASASYNNTVTGAIKIRLPIRANDTMWQMTVKIYDYSENRISEYNVGSYSYSTGAYNTAASFSGSGNATARTVRIGNEGGYDCVWIGDTGGTWSHPVIAVSNFVGGYANASASNWDDNWDISIVTAFGTVGATIDPTKRVYAITADSSMYSPIYYDSNNTGYFTDPAGRSRQASIDFGDGGYYIHGGDWGMRNSTPYGWIQFGPANSGHAHIYTDRSNFYFNAMLQVNGGSQMNTSDMRAYTFYDQNDTGYYIDPNSTSNSALRMRGGALFGPNPTWGAYLYVGTDGRAGTNATVAVTNGNLHIDAQDGYDIYLNHYNGRWTRTNGLYDNQDTAYYVDPNSTSRMLRIDFNNLYYAPDTSYGVIGTNGYFDTVNSGYASDPLELIYVRGNEVRIGPNGGDKPVKAATYYDYADTSYYVDANSTSVLSTVQALRFATNQGSQNPDSSHPGYGIRPFYSWNIGQANNSSAGYSNGITIGSHPSDQAYGFQIVQNMWDDNTYTRRYNSGWQSWITLLGSNNFSNYAVKINDWHGNLYHHTDGRIYATIFYDANDSAYYLDPNSTSRLAYLRPNRISCVNNQDNGEPRWDFKAYVVESQHHYGQNSTQTMYFGESNPIIVGGDIRSPVFYDSNNTGYYLDASSTGTSLNVAGAIVAASSVTAYSDVRVKYDIQPITDAVNKVKQLNGVTFLRNDVEDTRQTGVIAQDVLKVLPEAVRGSEKEMYRVAYGNMVGLLVEAIKEQQSEIDELKALVKQLLAK